MTGRQNTYPGVIGAAVTLVGVIVVALLAVLFSGATLASLIGLSGTPALIAVLVVCAVLIALVPAGTSFLVGRMWHCAACGAPLPTRWRQGMRLPEDVKVCAACAHPI